MEINQGSLLESPQDPPYRLREVTGKQAQIDQPIEMDDKCLEENLLAEGLLKTTEEPAYKINQTRSPVTQK